MSCMVMCMQTIIKTRISTISFKMMGCIQLPFCRVAHFSRSWGPELCCRCIKREKKKQHFRIQPFSTGRSFPALRYSSFCWLQARSGIKLIYGRCTFAFNQIHSLMLSLFSALGFFFLFFSIIHMMPLKWFRHCSAARWIISMRYIQSFLILASFPLFSFFFVFFVSPYETKFIQCAESVYNYASEWVSPIATHNKCLPTNLYSDLYEIASVAMWTNLSIGETCICVSLLLCSVFFFFSLISHISFLSVA